MATPKRVFVHIGLHKTGTTYLQNLFGANREQLSAQGVDFPGGQGDVAQNRAARDILGVRPRRFNDPRVPGAWDSLVESVTRRGLPTVLISEEALGACTVKKIRRIVESFGDREVHMVVTVRDLGRVVVSEWQEDIKNDRTWTWQQFIEAVRSPDRPNIGVARGFWRRQDLLLRLDRWAEVVPVERLHVVTVPQSGAKASELVERFASVIGLDAGRLTEQPHWNNENVGTVATEVIRRVNERLGHRLSEPAYCRAIQATLVPMMARRVESARPVLPEEDVPWVSERADELIAEILRRGCPVTGDVQDLRVTARAGRRPDDAGIEELLDESLEALAMLTEEYATSWWVRRKQAINSKFAESQSPIDRARGAIYEGKRRALLGVTRAWNARGHQSQLDDQG
jgi:hypothetical protein